MPTRSTGRDGRTPLSRERILFAAIELADADGIVALTMRNLAAALDVRPMAIYHHLANKDQILDGIVDLVFSEVEQPPSDAPWRPALESRSASVRKAMRRHPWATGLMESRREPGPGTLRHHDAVIGLLLASGFTHTAVAHAMAVLDAYVYGFVLQEIALPFDSPDDVSEIAEQILEQMPADLYPSFVEFAREHVLKSGYDFADEFEVGLTMVLDGISRLGGAPGHPAP